MDRAIVTVFNQPRNKEGEHDVFHVSHTPAGGQGGQGVKGVKGRVTG